MTADTVKRLLGARVDHFLAHRVIVCLFDIAVARRAEFHDIRSAEQTLVLPRMRGVAVAAILESDFMLKLPGEFLGVVTGETGLHSILCL